MMERDIYSGDDDDVFWALRGAFHYDMRNNSIYLKPSRK
jgi:hypothetical protein